MILAILIKVALPSEHLKYSLSLNVPSVPSVIFSSNSTPTQSPNESIFPLNRMYPLRVVFFLFVCNST